MSSIKTLILCEGETDQTLLGLYIESISEYRYCNKCEYSKSFSDAKINWYMDSCNNSYIGLWDNGGNQFEKTLEKICYRETRLEHMIESIVVVTDYDDETARIERPQKLYEVLMKGFGVDLENRNTLVNNEWVKFAFHNSFMESTIQVCYLLVPIDKVGALENYMLEALSEKNPEQNDVIKQAQDFIENIKTNSYLQHRREKTKAVLGVSLSIFNPERIFRIMHEILTDVDWGNFETSNKQFGIFRAFL